MGVGLHRSAYSSNIKTRLDFACGIFDSELRNVVQALHIPSMLGALVSSVPEAIREFGPENLSPGDAIITNDPHKGGTHLPDITVISPLFVGSEIFCYVANIAHHQDVGGRAPGSVPGDTTDIYQEGLIIPPTRFVRDWKIDKGILQLLLANVRSPDKRVGDYRAQVAANRLGMNRLMVLIEKYGAETLKLYMEEYQNYVENRMRQALKQIPKGRYCAVDFLDHDGINREPVKIEAEVEVREGEVTVDLSRSDRQGPGPMNATRAATLSAVSYIFKCLADPQIPVNDGLYRPISLVAPEGLVVNAKHPAAIAGCWEVAQRVCDVIMKAMSDVIPDKVTAAGKGIICNISFGGLNPRNNQLYSFYETIGGGYGARPNKDGIDGVQYHLTNTQNAPIEEVEMTYPIRIERYELIPDSEGAGRFRGGLGIRRDYRFPDHSVMFSIVSDRGRFAPWGLKGGLDARPSRYIVNPDSENPIFLESKATVMLKAGDLLSVQTPGGGGYGLPEERDPELVLRDVRDGKVSLERARNVYRVEINVDEWTVDWEKTYALRRKKSTS